MTTNQCTRIQPLFLEYKSVVRKPFGLWSYEVGATAVLLGILLFAPTLTLL
ncbi:hypothetical protein [Thiocystis violascens]|uniref:Uncharacterized protein n=1 Tax=Thiocystis violascens (strain ATCC 17096 / DSM 198 / 6111) TaxID=765911 RepID=I3YBV7_THIV6|nr:hypothetical protein [Thiocystis violascens]AFL74475.1 hypothetical protein Thivi_2537 [Thiocystis violascens DSM 198]